MSMPFSTRRRACVTIPLFSIRAEGDWGVGDIPGLGTFCSWAGDAGFQLVQILPFHEVWREESSPYSSLSAFALDPVYLGLGACEDFVACGGEASLDARQQEELASCRNASSIQWSQVRRLKAAAMQRAFDYFEAHELATGSARARTFAAYVAEQGPWLSEHALFMALAHELGPNWRSWPAPLRDRQPEALVEAAGLRARAILQRQYLEWQLGEQWSAMRTHARAGGVDAAGDLPYVVSRDASDVWRRQGDFRLDLSAGTPPDAFSADGQDWGLPIYNWEAVSSQGFPWMRARAARARALCGLWRVDHVIGLYRSFFRDGTGRSGFTPEGEAAQVQLGEALMDVLAGSGEIVAEDLGMVPRFLRPSLQRLGIPGYRVMRWERQPDAPGDTGKGEAASGDPVQAPDFMDPAAWPAVSVATSGTHDTEGLAEWYETLSAHDRAALARLPGLAAAGPHRPWSDDLRDALLRAVYRAGSALAILPFFDLLGTRERINVPGTVSGENWTCRMPMSVQALMQDRTTTTRLADLAHASGRGAL